MWILKRIKLMKLGFRRSPNTEVPHT